MAKLSRPTVKAVIITSRKRADGTCPIVIRVQFNGRAEKYLPISVLQSLWNITTSRVSSKSKNCLTYNRLISNEIEAVEKRVKKYEELNIPYTAKMLLQDDSIDNAMKDRSLRIIDLIEGIKKVKHYSENTYNSFIYSYNLVKEYSGNADVKINDLSQDYIEGMCRYFNKRRGVAVGTINLMCSRISTLYRYAQDMGLVEESNYPFKKFKYWIEYRSSESRFGLNEDFIHILESWFVDSCADVDVLNGTWSYRMGVVSQLLRKRSSLRFVCAMLLLCYKMQGLALVDLAHVRAENITIQTIDGQEYYIFSGIRRQKTNEAIDIISVKRNDINSVIFDAFIDSMAERNGWFLPILSDGRDKKESEILNYTTKVISRKCKDLFRQIDKEKDGIISSLGFDLSKITYYTFRHTFASVYVNEKGGNPTYLANMMGRSVNGIFRYVNNLNNIESLIKEKNKMDD